VNVVGVGVEEEVRKLLRRGGLILLRREHLGGGGNLGGKRRREEAMMLRVGVMERRLCSVVGLGKTLLICFVGIQCRNQIWQAQMRTAQLWSRLVSWS
jgi:hypothetical protein